MQSTSFRVPVIRRDKESISEQKCSVCACLTREFHFGAVCCVACGAFFRRAVSEGRVFETCRKKGTCAIDTNGRTTCRWCRFQKCISVGMDPAAVQNSRGSLGKRNDVCETPAIPDYLPHIDCNSPHLTNFVETLILAYGTLKHHRKYLYSNGTLSELIRGESPRPQKVNIFARIRKDALRTECALALNFLGQCKLFGTFDAHDKEELYKNFLVMMTVMEKNYVSMLNGGIEQNRLYHVDGSYSDLNDEETAFPPEALAAKMDRDTMMKLFLEPCVEHLKTVATPMRDMGMKDADFLGFLAYTLFDPDIPTLRPERRYLVDQARSKIRTDWLEMYAKQRIPDGQQRIASCMRMLPILQEILEEQKEKFHLLRVFKLFDYDEILNDLFSFKSQSEVMQTQVNHSLYSL